jgi:hypothetical protein
MDERPVIITSMFILLKWQELHNFSFGGRRLGNRPVFFVSFKNGKGWKGCRKREWMDRILEEQVSVTVSFSCS